MTKFSNVTLGCNSRNTMLLEADSDRLVHENRQTLNIQSTYYGQLNTTVGGARSMGELPKPLYRTRNGAAYVGDSLDLLKCVEDSSIDLVVTCPPFDLQRQKKYASNDGHFEREN